MVLVWRSSPIPKAGTTRPGLVPDVMMSVAAPGTRRQGGVPNTGHGDPGGRREGGGHAGGRGGAARDGEAGARHQTHD